MSRKRKRAQALVEIAMVAPMLFILLTAVFDFGRAAYTWSVLAAAAREGGRISVPNGPAAVLPTDDTVINQTRSMAFGIALTGAACVHGQSSGTLTPAPATANTGYIYILPVGASTNPNSPAGTSGSVSAGCNPISTVSADATALEVVIVYRFVPFTPFASQFMNNGITMTASSVMYTEY